MHYHEPGHERAAHCYSLVRTAPELEKKEATGLTHLPNTATKTELWKEGGWKQLSGEGPGARHPPPLLQLCKELKRH